MKNIKEIPENDRPRERLIRNGAGNLSDAELMAILIGRGTEGRDVMSLAEQILTTIESDHGEIRLEALQKIEGVGTTKAAIVAG
jgi:DNA repair protein RadC